MDPSKLFLDERLAGYCVYCGQKPSTRDHVPSRVLLDEPFPPDLPVVPACKACNESFSLDEQYLACLIECAIAGSTDPRKVGRERIRQILSEETTLASRIESSRLVGPDGRVFWRPEENRVTNVLLKLARGHAAYELSELQLEQPTHLLFAPISTLGDEQLQPFFARPTESMFPEIGSRAFCKVLAAENGPSPVSDWQIVQEGRYEYLVSYSGRVLVRIVIGNYLACEVVW